jgi:hypothetical protein
MSDLRKYALGLEREIVPPDLSQLERVATRRGRQRATTLVAAAVLALSALISLFPDGTPGRTLPAVTPVPTVTDIAGLNSLTPAQIGAVPGARTENLSAAKDGHPATIRQASVCLDPHTGRLVGGPQDGSARCRAAWEFTNGGRRIWTPAARDVDGFPVWPQYVGNGDYVHAVWGETEPVSYIIDTDTMRVTELQEGGTVSGGPGSGRHLVSCGVEHIACVLDVRAGRLETLDRASLPSWVDDLSRTIGTMVLPMVPVNDGADGLYVLPQGLGTLSDEARTPLLVSQSMAEAVRLTTGKPVPPEPGLIWVSANSGKPHAVNTDTRTINPIELPRANNWAHNTIGGFWGLGIEEAGSRTAVWVDAKGAVGTHVIYSGTMDGETLIADGGSSSAMTYYVKHPDGPWRLHVSVDRGKSWRVLEVPTGYEGPAGNGQLVTGWESWPEVR